MDNESLFQRAKQHIPGGVNSPVRAFLNVQMTPKFIKSAKGQYIKDIEGNTYLDFIGSWGPMILGHNPPCVLEAVQKAVKDGLSFGAATEKEVEMAELVCSIVPNVEMVRMLNSGTEAVMSAIRCARGYTKKDKIIKFAGCYHGHCDSMLVQAGSGVMTKGISSSAGVPEGAAKDTLTAKYNDLENVRELLDANKNEVAAIIVEPVGANMGVVLPQKGFLQGLRKLCDQYNALLIFDEVITGFRLALGGAQEMFNINADLITMGKIIGGGMPVGAFGGKKEIMQCIAPLGDVYQAGTLSGNPIAMAAGISQLKYLKSHPEVYTNLEEKSTFFFNGIDTLLKKYHIPATLNHIASLGSVFFTKEHVYNYETAKTSDTNAYMQYFKYLIEHDIYIASSQFEAMFLNNAFTKENLCTTLGIIENYCKGEQK